ncbi:MAG: hypothetical protein U0269_35115 [Polyangiales bacterium]
MGSQFVTLYIADPAVIQAKLRGDDPDIASALYASDPKLAPALRPAFEVIGKGLLCFMDKQREHPEGHVYLRAVEHILDAHKKRSGSLEFYPDEGEYPLWSLTYDRCEAEWLTVPQSESGIPTLAWRSPQTCRSLASSMRRALSTGEFNQRFSPDYTLTAAIELLDEGASTNFGVFAMFQG